MENDQTKIGLVAARCSPGAGEYYRLCQLVGKNQISFPECMGVLFGFRPNVGENDILPRVQGSTTKTKYHSFPGQAFHRVS